MRNQGFKIYLLAATLLPAVCVAQDSVQNVLSQQFREQYSFLSQDVVSQPLLQKTNYSMLEGGYTGAGGSYILAQDADKQRNFFFNTHGTKKIKNVLITGLFAYNNTRKDSVAFTLRDNLHDAAPYYFFAGKKGNWQTVNYQLQGMLSSAFMKNKLTGGLSFKYNSSDAWRGNDPRSEYFLFDMLISGMLQYNLSPKHSIGGEFGLTRNGTDINLEYRNEDYRYSQTKPEYINYMQDGYGFQELKTGNSNVAGNVKGYIVKGIYSGRWRFGDVVLKPGYEYRHSNFYQKSTGVGAAQVSYGSFYEDIYTVDFLWRYKKQNKLWSLQAGYINHLGKDFNNLLQGHNYVYSFEQFSVHPVFGKYAANGLVQYEAGIHASVADLLKIDGTANQKAEYQFSNLQFFGAYYFHFKNNGSMLKTMLHAGVYIPVSSEMNIPLQQPSFTQAVIFRDYYYYNATAYNGGAELQYDFPVKNTRPFVSAKINYTQAKIKEPSYVKPATMPGNMRLNWQLSVGLIL